jgi:hypothetical protein
MIKQQYWEKRKNTIFNQSVPDDTFDWELEGTIKVGAFRVAVFGGSTADVGGLWPEVVTMKQIISKK